jgi:fructose-bisphosphate aldolase class I
MHALARYSALCQEQGLVPIVEPEILMDGTHSIDDCRSATARSLISVFEELDAQNVDLEGIVLKPNMVISGSDAPNRASAAEVARQTIDCFLETVPTNVPGIAFLSGGQDDEESVVNLDEISKIANTEELPWELTYSYGRGLQAAPLAAWLGKSENIPAAQAAFQKRGLDSSSAREGVYAL